LGGYGEHVERPEQIEAALERAFASGRPACVNVVLDPEGMAKTNASSPYIV
jgi:acetolactate synthase-1/2/3 large subunit